MVSKALKSARDKHFKPGVRITHWNGMPMSVAVSRNADTQAGSNADARHARGLDSLTIRPLAQSVPPDEDWVTVRYLDKKTGKPHERTFEWAVFEPGTSVGPGLDELTGMATALGLDAETHGIQQIKKMLFVPGIYKAEKEAGSEILHVTTTGGKAQKIEHQMTGVFRARRVADPDGNEYGYIRIYTFAIGNLDKFIENFILVLEQMPERGLILDVRGNPGGFIPAAERLLQLFTPRRVQPALAQFLNTPLNLRLCQKHAPSTRFEGFDLSPWIKSIRDSVWSGDTYSKGIPITDPESCQDIGQRYFGPVVLIIDPLCYSATDMFAAGFQDHAIGEIIGVFGKSGAGGANVWSHTMLRTLMEPDGDDPDENPFVSLPEGAGFRIAVRRTVRVGGSRGDILEDTGVTPDVRYSMRETDLLDKNRGLIQAAIMRLQDKPRHAIHADIEPRDGTLPQVDITTENVDRLDIKLSAPDGGFGSRWLQTVESNGAPVTIDLAKPLGDVGEHAVRMEIVGYRAEVTDDRRSERLVARRIVNITPG